MLSLIIPIFNEEKLIIELVKRTISALESFITDYEVIFVDDGEVRTRALTGFCTGSNKTGR